MSGASASSTFDCRGAADEMPRLLVNDNVACFIFGGFAMGSFPCACLLRVGGITRAATHHAAHSIQRLASTRKVDRHVARRKVTLRYLT